MVPILRALLLGLRAPFEWLAPEETASQRALPLTLVLRPAPVLALACLGLNDWVLKGSGLVPGVVTGKLSDFAGLAYFPLLLVTAVNLVGHALAVVKRRPLWLATPTRAKLLAACVVTGVVFCFVKLSPWARDAFEWSLAAVRPWSSARPTVVLDAWDLVALVSLPLSYALGAAALRRLPPGRLALMRHGAAGGDALDGVRRPGSPMVSPLLAEVEREVAGADRPEVIDRLLARLREVTTAERGGGTLG